MKTSNMCNVDKTKHVVKQNKGPDMCLRRWRKCVWCRWL